MFGNEAGHFFVWDAGGGGGGGGQTVQKEADGDAQSTSGQRTKLEQKSEENKTKKRGHIKEQGRDMHVNKEEYFSFLLFSFSPHGRFCFVRRGGSRSLVTLLADLLCSLPFTACSLPIHCELAADSLLIHLFTAN
jgi:hypothetical protein